MYVPLRGGRCGGHCAGGFIQTISRTITVDAM